MKRYEKDIKVRADTHARLVEASERKETFDQTINRLLDATNKILVKE